MRKLERFAAALSLTFISLFAASPAFASEGEKIDTLAQYSHSGDPFDIVAIAITAVVLLAIVLIGSTLIGNLFEKKK